MIQQKIYFYFSFKQFYALEADDFFIYEPLLFFLFSLFLFNKTDIHII